MNDFLKGLNDVQHAAVTNSQGPVMVVAGPGSGKTRVLTFRIAQLIQQGVAPHHILALTFTNKSAREMKDRIEKVVGTGAQGLWAGTFHSIFAKILRYEADKIGYPNNFTIYDTADTKNLIKTIVKELNLSKDQYPPNAVYSRISTAKSKLISPKKYASDDKLKSMDGMKQMGEFHRIYDRYATRCKQAGAMDFDDLLYRTYELFQTQPEVLQRFRERFQYVLVDEFQDTNFLQYAIIHKLVKYEGSPENICIVGDDAQSIYAFRGATIKNILDFEKDFPHAKVFKLEQNYRSTPHIVAAANTVIKHNKDQIQKKIWTQHDAGHKIKLIKALSDSEEGRRIADAILELKNRNHVDNQEIAILYRTNAQSRIFEESLRKYNIPYKVYGGMSFYQRKEIKDMLAYFRLAINPNDEEALRRVINYPKRGIGDGTLAKYATYAIEQEKSLWEALQELPTGGKAGAQIQAFVKMIQDSADKAQAMNAYDAAFYIYSKSGISAALKADKTIEGMSRTENLDALMDGIQDYTQSDDVTDVIDPDSQDRTLANYIQNIALLTDQDKNEDTEDHVMLMSVHAAKGLEFDAVLVVGMEENLFPSFLSRESEKDMDEERRLFYVAITRARRHLVLSFASSRYRFGKVVYNTPSRFLEEIDTENYENPSALDLGGGSEVSLFDSADHSTASGKSSVLQGNFTNTRRAVPASKMTIPADFVAAAPEDIQSGQRVLHLKFGEGTVVNVDGRGDGKVATITFSGITNPNRRLMLKFAKLQILAN